MAAEEAACVRVFRDKGIPTGKWRTSENIFILDRFDIATLFLPANFQRTRPSKSNYANRCYSFSIKEVCKKLATFLRYTELLHNSFCTTSATPGRALPSSIDPSTRKESFDDFTN